MDPIQIAAVAVVLVALDVVYETVSYTSSETMVKRIQGRTTNLRGPAVIAAYAFMIAAVYFFAVQPSRSWKNAASRGALLGLVMYGMFDMTNYAALDSYSLTYAVTDIAWGTVLFAATAAAASLVVK